MKLSSSLSLIWSVTTTYFCWNNAADAQEVLTENLQQCIDPATFDPNTDYFPEKISPQDSTLWTVEYFNSYKLLRNTAVNEVFVLYQCGTPIPSVENPDEVTEFIRVPLQDGAILTSTTHIPHFEQLGLLPQLRGWIGDTFFISSPCVNELIKSGDIKVVLRADQTDQTLVDGLLESIGPEVVFFHNSRNMFTSSLTNVTVSASLEKDNEAIYEWSSFFALFFNLETASSALVTAASTRYDCYTAEAAVALSTVDSGVKPTIMWAAYNNFTGTPAWDIAICPNFYCEYANLCGAELLDQPGDVGSVSFFGRQIHTPEEFYPLAMNADVLIYPAFDWDTTYELFQDELNQFKSVQNKKVFDVQASGPNAWFEGRIAEYDIVFQDFCSVVGLANQIHVRQWLRNVFTEEIGAFASTCEGDPLEIQFETRATACAQPVVDDVPQENETSQAPKKSSVGIAVLVVVSLAAFVL